MKSLIGLLLTAITLRAQDTSGAGSLCVRVPGAPAAQVCLIPGSCERPDPGGFVRFPALRPGTYQIEVQKQRTSVEVRAGLETNVELTLAELRPQQQSIEVSTSTLIAPAEIRTSVHLVEGEEVRTSAAAIKDVSRHLQTLPGVIFGGNDFVNDLIVRGGHPQENLFIIDNVEVPTINHFSTLVTTGGIVGQMNAELLEGVTFLTGGYPAAYNNRLSSVLQLTQREGSREKVRGQATAGWAGAGGVAEGPLGGKGSWIVSARRSMWDAFTNDLGFGGVPIYTNFQGKFVYDLNASNRLWLSSIGGRDSTSVRPRADRKAQEADPYNADSSGWRNSAGLNWQQLYGTRGVGLLGLSWSRVTVDDLVKDIRLNNATVYRARSFDQEFTAKYDLTLEVPGLHRLQAGVALRALRPNYRIEAPLGSENPFSPDVARVNPIDLSQRATLRQQSAYAQFSRTLTTRLSITIGARADRYRYLDTTRVSPRLGLTYRLTENLSAHASAGAYSQQPAFTYVAVLPVNRGLMPMRSTHFVGGLTWVPTPSVRATIEGYEKRYADYPVALEYPQITLASTPYMWGAGYLMTSLTSAGRGRARGIEFSIEKKLTRRFHVQANLTVASSRHAALDQILRPGGYDSRCVSNLIGGYRFNDRWSLAIRYTEVTGRPYTPFDLEKSTAQNRGVLDLRRVNAVRAPDYKRLDLRLDRNIQFHGGLLNVYVGIQNAFNRKNFYTEVWNFRTNTPKTENQLGAFPMIGLEWRFR